MLTSLLNMLWFLVKWPIYILFGIVLFFYLNVLLHLFYQIVVKKKRPRKAKYKHNYKRKPLKDLFWYFPQQCALDMLNKNPDAFPYQGVIIFEGRQGYGKTIAMMEFTRLMQLQYPEAKCLCNISYEYRDEALTHWRKLLTYDNGEEGVIVDIDEIHNWFSSKDSKDFPPDMLTTVTTNRKSLRIICGTVQQFYMVAKDIRTQATEVRSCRTFLGCITFVIRKLPMVDSDGIIQGYKFLGMYFFAHKPVLRESYDTREIVNRLAKVGFNERPVDVKVDMSQFR